MQSATVSKSARPRLATREVKTGLCRWLWAMVLEPHQTQRAKAAAQAVKAAGALAPATGAVSARAPAQSGASSTSPRSLPE
jgi:hypothetical protein